MREKMISKHTQDFQMNISTLLKKKRDGEEFTKNDIEYLICNLVKGQIVESQIGAMLMAMYIRGLTDSETADLTRAMVYSGDILQWDPQWHGILVDKHSTGGVGDKISLILAPIMAACGLKVPMVSGRSLEHTGGTLDKLESIPGFMVDLDTENMRKALDHAGCFITAANNHLCPADKILYRVRDITCTVDSINLVASSIISKKIASGTKILVVDVKVGKGAFFKTVDMGRALAKQLIRVSGLLGIKTRVVLSRMDEPLGQTVGNALEVTEAVQCLSGNMSPQIHRIIHVLGSNLLQMTELCANDVEATEMINRVICDGSAVDHFCRMLLLQGVNEETVDGLIRGDSVLPTAKYNIHFKAPTSGWVAEIDAMAVGRVCQCLGACRQANSPAVDHSVGVQVHRHVGERVDQGEVWLTVHSSTPSLPPGTEECLTGALTISSTKLEPQDIIIQVIT